MKIDDWTSNDDHTLGGGETPPCVGLTSNALPEAQSIVSAESLQTGVSTNYALLETKQTTLKVITKHKPLKMEDRPHWYALRCTYGRENTAYEYMAHIILLCF